MKKLDIKETRKSPRVYLNPENGEFYMYGRFIMTNSNEFYEPIFKWFNDYSKKPKQSNTLHYCREYSNSASSRSHLELFRLLNTLPNFKLIWYTDENDEDMIEAGRDFESILKISFEYKVGWPKIQ